MLAAKIKYILKSLKREDISVISSPRLNQPKGYVSKNGCEWDSNPLPHQSPR